MTVSPDELPSFDETDSHQIQPAQLLRTGSVETETIDLSHVLTQDLTDSGSFNALDDQGSSFYRLLQALPMPTLLLDMTQRIIFSNEAVARISGEKTDLQGTFLASLFVPQAAARISTLFDQILRTRKPTIKEEQLTISKNTIWARIYFRPIRFSTGRGVLLLLEDLTLEKRQMLLMDRIEQAKKEWEQTFDTVQDGIFILDSSYRIIRLNKAAAKRIGIPVEEAVGQQCYRLFHGEDSPPPFCPFSKCLSAATDLSAEYRDNKTGCFYDESVFPKLDGIELAGGAVAIIRDISDRKLLEEELQRRASYDALTNLFNRHTLLQMLTSAFANALRYRVPLTISLCDLDNFKQINDQFGHKAGDTVLKEFGVMVGAGLRRADFAGRYGGDEFILVFPHTSASGASESTKRIIAAFNGKTFRAGSKSFRAGCTAGVAEFCPNLSSPDDLVHLADVALYEAKKHGRNKVVISKPTQAV